MKRAFPHTHTELTLESNPCSVVLLFLLKILSTRATISTTVLWMLIRDFGLMITDTSPCFLNGTKNPYAVNSSLIITPLGVKSYKGHSVPTPRPPNTLTDVIPSALFTSALCRGKSLSRRLRMRWGTHEILPRFDIFSMCSEVMTHRELHVIVEILPA